MLLDAMSLLSMVICFARLMAVKKDDFARSTSSSRENVVLLRTRNIVTEARSIANETCTGAIARSLVLCPISWIQSIMAQHVERSDGRQSVVKIV